MVPKVVRAKQLVELPLEREVEEEYVDYVEVPTTRQKEVWVKKVVEEPCFKKVPVAKVRKVKVPAKVFQEVEMDQTVAFPEPTAVEVDGYRVDEVQETKLVEVEELQTETINDSDPYHPSMVTSTHLLKSRDITPLRRLPDRRQGTTVFHPADPRHRYIEQDEFAPIPLTSQTTSSQPTYLQSTLSSRLRGSSAAEVYQPNTANYNTNNPFSSSSSSSSAAYVAPASSRLGFKVRCLSAASAPGSCVVYDVEVGQAASRAGLLPNDVVLSANGKQINTLQDFKTAVATTKGPLIMHIKRNGSRYVVTVQR